MPDVQCDIELNFFFSIALDSIDVSMGEAVELFRFGMWKRRLLVPLLLWSSDGGDVVLRSPDILPTLFLSRSFLLKLHRDAEPGVIPWSAYSVPSDSFLSLARPRPSAL